MLILGRCLLALWLGLLAFTSAARGLVWQSEFRLWQDTVQKAPWKPRSLINYGEQVQDQGDLQSALALFERSYQAIRWRQDHRASVSKYYTVQDIVANLIRQHRETELWPLLDDAGCDRQTTADGKTVTWKCRVTPW